MTTRGRGAERKVKRQQSPLYPLLNKEGRGEVNRESKSRHSGHLSCLHLAFLFLFLRTPFSGIWNLLPSKVPYIDRRAKA